MHDAIEGYAKPRYLISLLLVAAIVYATPRYLNLVLASGFMIPQPDMATDYLKGIVWGVLLGLSILAWPVSAQNKRLLLAGWSVKLVVCLLFMLFYEGHYLLDAYMYFDYSRLGGFSFQELSFRDGTLNIVNLARLHRQLLPDSYHAMKLTFSMSGLLGTYLFYRAAVIFAGREIPRLFCLLAFFPGIPFWASILGKEPVVFLGIGLYCYGVSGWYCRRRASYMAAICSGIALALFIRQWLGLIMVLPMGVALFFGLRGMLSRLLLLLCAGAAGYFSAATLLERFKISAFQDLLRTAESTTTGFVNTAGGSTQALQFDFSSPAGVISFLPYGAFTALFRPLPGEVMNPFGLLAGLESLILLILLLLALKRTPLCELKNPLLLWALLFVACWSLVNGIVSATNFGVAVRYKLQILPVLLGLLLYLSRRRKALPALSAASSKGRVTSCAASQAS